MLGVHEDARQASLQCCSHYKKVAQKVDHSARGLASVFSVTFLVTVVSSSSNCQSTPPPTGKLFTHIWFRPDCLPKQYRYPCGSLWKYATIQAYCCYPSLINPCKILTQPYLFNRLYATFAVSVNFFVVD